MKKLWNAIRKFFTVDDDWKRQWRVWGKYHT